MIEYIEGDIFESPAQVIVNPTNTVGVMGKGLALSFKQRYPEMFKKYKAVCKNHLFSVGKLMLFYETDHWVLLFPTKEHWRGPSKLEYIEKGLLKFVQTYESKNITSIAFPKLGCGNGELDWADVKPLMEKYLKDLPIDVYVYTGLGHDTASEREKPARTVKHSGENANGTQTDILGNTKQNLRHPLAYGEWTKERFDAEIQKGFDDVESGKVYAVEDVEEQMRGRVQTSKKALIEDLLEGYGGEYSSKEIDWGEPAGKEIW